MFTHLYQREHFTEPEVRIYIAEIVVALERLHNVRILLSLIRTMLLYHLDCKETCPISKFANAGTVHKFCYL